MEITLACWLTVLLSTLLFFVFGHRCRNLLLPPTITGAVPILGHLHLLNGFGRWQKPLHRTLTAISTKYGPVLFLRFGSRPVLSVSSPEAVEQCLTINDITFFNRPFLLTVKYLAYNSSTLATTSYDAYWRKLRRIATVELFTPTSIQAFIHWEMKKKF